MTAAQSRPRVAAEMALCIACCRREPDADEIDRLASNLDWERLVSLARFHRVEGLVWRGLGRLQAKIPADAAVALAADARRIAIANMRAAAECRRLRQEFNGVGVKLLFLKGQTLGALAYGDPTIKSAIDVDILVDPADLARAAKLLSSSGYVLVEPRGADEEALKAWHRRSKESVWLKDSLPLQLDLHTAVSDSPALIGAIDIHSPTQMVDVGGNIRLPTFATDELFAYLAVHGAWSCWYRLKWIADIAGLVGGIAPDEISRIYRRALELGGGRAVKQTLLLADSLFASLAENPELRRELEDDPTTRRLRNRALRFLLSERGEPTGRRFGTVPIHWMHFQLLEGPRARLAELSRKARWLWFRLRRGRSA